MAGPQTQEVALSPLEDYIKKWGVIQGEAMCLLSNYYEEPVAQEWPAKEESVAHGVTTS